LTPYDDIPAIDLLMKWNDFTLGYVILDRALIEYMIDNLTEIRKEAARKPPLTDGFDKFKSCRLHKRLSTRGSGGRRWVIKNPLKTLNKIK
jgi:hypothetical protein